MCARGARRTESTRPKYRIRRYLDDFSDLEAGIVSALVWVPRFRALTRGADNMTACAVIIAVTLSSVPADLRPEKGGEPPAFPSPSLSAAIATTAVPAPEKWMVDRKANRPGTLHVLYGTLAALQGFDVYSTRRAMAAGANEVNPIVNNASGSPAAMLAVKAMSTAGSIFFAERAWKKNPKAAVVLMAVVNGVTAAIVARNVRNAR